MAYKKAKVVFSQIGGSAIQFDLAASEKDPRFLVFKNAILARAEVNANHDQIFPEGITELAGTIAGCPINDEHSDQFVGAFTAGRPQDNALSVDGFIWAVRWPDLADSIKDGRKGLSVEASADKIVCSKCGKEYDKETGKSCPHIMSKRAKEIHGATRQLHGLTAMGGATTYTPAGTGAQFSNQIYMVASKEGTDNLICVGCGEDVIPNGNICPKCGIDIVAVIQGGSPSQMEKKMEEKEKEAEVKDEEKKEAEEEKKEGEVKESIDFKAEIDKLTAALGVKDTELNEAKAKLEAAQKALEDERAARVAVEARYTARVLASLLEGDELKTAVEKAKGMTLDQIDLLASVGGKQKPTKAGLNFLDLSGEAKGQPTKIKLTL